LKKRVDMTKYLLKRFGMLKVNKYVEYAIHPDILLVYVYYFDDWHTVLKNDVVL